MLHEVVAALIVRSRQVLLGRRSPTRDYYPDVWDVFGGHIEAGEQQSQTLIRELQEELGITPVEWNYLETITIPASSSDEPSDSLILHLYLVTEWAGTPQNLQLHEHSTMGWFSVAEAVELPLADPSYRELFARYLS